MTDFPKRPYDSTILRIGDGNYRILQVVQKLNTWMADIDILIAKRFMQVTQSVLVWLLGRDSI